MASLFDAVKLVQERYQEELLRKKNVVGVAMGYKDSAGVKTDQPAVAVLVEEKKPLEDLHPDDAVPKEIDGVRTDVVVIGKMVALDNGFPSNASPRARYRPTIPAGVSIGHYKVTAGTLGTLVKDRVTGAQLILSNNHVLANSNEATQGDPILQPGPLDGGQNPADMIAVLERFLALKYIEGDAQPPAQPKPAKPTTPTTTTQADGCSNLLSVITAIGKLFGATTPSTSPQSASAQAADASTAVIYDPSYKDNRADCALARPTDPSMFLDSIVNIGAVTQTAAPALGMPIRKSGRTSATTESKITLLNATVTVAYNTSVGQRSARFTGQVICDAFSQGGDSGALVVDMATNRAVGLLFAGSGLASMFTPIDVVLDILNVTLD